MTIDPAAWRARWPNFAPAEVACRGCAGECGRDRFAIVPEALDLLQVLRDRIGESLRLNSAYRCPFHNAFVGGAPLSRHKVGDAFDISVAGRGATWRARLLAGASAVGFTGIGFYRTFLHVDTGPRRQWSAPGGKATWTG